MEKVGIYCRLSDEDRDKINKNDDSDSIINQRSMCLKYANQFGWNVIDIYTDDDFSGAGTYRPDFERMIKDCETGKINLVLCKSQSRFSRDMEVIEKYLHNKFAIWGVRFVSIIDNADTNIESNKKSRQINGLINEWYLEDLSHNIKKSLKNKREDGLFMGSFAPYGYIKDPNNKHKLIIDPIASKIVKKIFEMYSNGKSYKQICDYLDNNNVLPCILYKRENGYKHKIPYNNLNHKWSINTISGILKNEVYIGNLVQGKVTSISYKVHKSRRVDSKYWTKKENTHEAIIDIETWNKVQSILGTHQKPTKTNEKHYLCGKVYCANCKKVFNRNVYYEKRDNNKLRAYLRCSLSHKDINYCNNNKQLKLNELEEILINSLNDISKNLFNKEKLQKNYEKYIKNTTKEEQIKLLEKEKNNIEINLNDYKKYYQSLYEDKVKGIISEDMFNSMSSNYITSIKKETKKLNEIKEQLLSFNISKFNKIDVYKILKKYENKKELRNIIIKEFIDKIYIDNYNELTKERDIEINWDFK